jgi:acylpyruvate hydrolase
MNLATVLHAGRSYAARVEGDEALLLDAADVGELLRQLGGTEGLDRVNPVDRVAWADVTVLPVVPRPDKVMCIGQNYQAHIAEVGATTPEYPTVFAKYRGALIGHGNPIMIPAISERLDWEVELVAVIGRTVRNAGADEAAAAIAGYTVGNDISARDLQGRTSQWLQGKTCEATTPVGPWLTTADVTGVEPDLAISCAIDGVVRQSSRTSDMLFKPVHLVSYLSQVITLEPGDLIFTGTPAGVGQGLKPPVFLSDGQVVVSTIERIGTLENPCRQPA